MHLTFVDYQGKKITLDVEPSDKILNISNKLFELTGRFDNIEIDGKKINFAEIYTAANNKLIKDYEINEQSSLKLLPFPFETTRDIILDELEALFIQNMKQLSFSGCAGYPAGRDRQAVFPIPESTYNEILKNISRSPDTFFGSTQINPSREALQESALTGRQIP